MNGFLKISAAFLATTISAIPVSAGRLNGPGSTVTIVEAYSTDTFNEWFRGGELAYITIEGDGDTDLDLYVYDSAGHLVASDLGYTDSASVAWTPSRTGSYRIEVRNLGRVWNRYALATN